MSKNYRCFRYLYDLKESKETENEAAGETSGIFGKKNEIFKYFFVQLYINKNLNSFVSFYYSFQIWK